MTDDAELLSRYARDRSEAAFAEVVGRHVDLVYSAALRQCRGDHHRAEEVTQMVFTDLARKAAALSRHPVLPAWLHRSSHLASLDILRKESRRHKHERAAGAEAILASSSVDAPAWDKIGPVLDESINQLDERDRQAILLRYFGNRPFGEIGPRLKLSENAARMRVERALSKLHGLLAARGITSSSAALALAITGNAVAAAPAGVFIASASAGAGIAGATGAWIALMSTSKFPIALTAAVLASAATVIALQDKAGSMAAAEFADLSLQNHAISKLRAENRMLSLSAGQTHDLLDEESNIRILQQQVAEFEAKADDRRAFATARLRANRSSGPDSADADSADANFHVQPKVMTQVRPEYPAEMRATGTGGEVLVDVIVNKEGAVQNAFAASSSNKAFEDAAVNAVSQWTFMPGLANGHAILTHMQIPIVFALSSEPPPPTATTWF